MMRSCSADRQPRRHRRGRLTRSTPLAAFRWLPGITAPAAVRGQQRAAGVGHRGGTVSRDRAARRRAASRAHRSGQEVVAALSDVMLAAVGHLGYVGDVHINGRRGRRSATIFTAASAGNFQPLTAAGHDHRVTPRQWRALGRATGLADKLAMVGAMMEVDLETETAGSRPATRSPRCWRAGAPPGHWSRLPRQFAGSGACWGPFQGLHRDGARRPAMLADQPTVRDVEQPGIGRYRCPACARFLGAPREPNRPAPLPRRAYRCCSFGGARVSTGEIGRLHDRRHRGRPAWLMRPRPRPGPGCRDGPGPAGVRLLEERLYEFNVQATGASPMACYSGFFCAIAMARLSAALTAGPGGNLSPAYLLSLPRCADRVAARGYCGRSRPRRGPACAAR